jgi:hypothetical protein
MEVGLRKSVEARVFYRDGGGRMYSEEISRKDFDEVGWRSASAERTKMGTGWYVALACAVECATEQAEHS